MGGASSEIDDATSEVLLEAAYFDPMTIARSSKRHGLRSEASHRNERGVDPELALRAAARFVEILSLSVPELEWLKDPLDVRGVVPAPPTMVIRDEDVERLLGVKIAREDIVSILERMDFLVGENEVGLNVTAPTRRPDIREGSFGRADVIEEIARLYGYERIPRHHPAWPEVGGLTEHQQLRRQLRRVVVDAGALEAWTSSLGSDADFDLLRPDEPRVRVTNPLAADESVLRATLVTGLVRAWARNVERGTGDVILAEFGVVFEHPSVSAHPRLVKGGVGGALTLELPRENERLTIILGRPEDDAKSAVALWHLIQGRLGLADVVVRSLAEVPPGLHPTRAAELVDRASGAVLGYVGEVDAELVTVITSVSPLRRLGVIDLDVDALADPNLATRRSPHVRVPSRYPSAVVDLAFVTPRHVNAADLGEMLRRASDLVESVSLFDVYEGAGLPEGTRSLAYSVRFSSLERTLSDTEISEARAALIVAAASLTAELR
jgi:phenylalanyl-tRNA synthetase beta chain